MITLKNWYQQQPEVVYFVQTNFQGDEFMKKLVRSEMNKETWDKTIDRYSDCSDWFMVGVLCFAAGAIILLEVWILLNQRR